MALLKREFGGIQPCWRVGLFRIRLPFIHFRISPPEVVTGLMNAYFLWRIGSSDLHTGSRSTSSLGIGCI